MWQHFGPAPHGLSSPRETAVRIPDVERNRSFEIEASKRIGVPLPRIEGWRAADREKANTLVPVPLVPRATSETALVPVCIRDELPFGPMISFSTPSGYRVEGLSLDQALGLLRAFA